MARSNHREKALIIKRNNKIIERYNYWSNIKSKGVEKYSHAWIMASLQDEFFLSEFWLKKILRTHVVIPEPSNPAQFKLEL